MKHLTKILILTIAAAAGCATEPTRTEGPQITCPSETSCEADPRLPSTRVAVDELGLDLDHGVRQLALVDASSKDEALASVGAGAGAIALSSCSAGALHGACCWYEPGNWIKCVGW
jgi:hypothetical protein